jgi:hypothetical protein
MCHLTKEDTARAIAEMRRVLKPGGLCFLGVISMDTWPPLGREIAPGEFQCDEGGDEPVVHSAFTDLEADRLVSGWQIVHKEKRVMWSWGRMSNLSSKEWMEMYEELEPDCLRNAWEALYDKRTTQVQYTHLYYLLKK